MPGERGEMPSDQRRRLLHRHEELEHEVALLRTIVLKLVSDPVDRNLEPPTD